MNPNDIEQLKFHLQQALKIVDASTGTAPGSQPPRAKPLPRKGNGNDTSREFPSKYPGTCWLCKRKYQEGESIISFQDDEKRRYVHPACRPEEWLGPSETETPDGEVNDGDFPF